jgi:hypothetical protein
VSGIIYGTKAASEVLTPVEYLKLFTTLYSAAGKLVGSLLTRKQLRRHQAEAASRLASLLNRYVTDCYAAAADNGYPDYMDPARYDYRERSHQCPDPTLALPEIRDWELLPLVVTDGARAIENQQNDIPGLLRDARETDDGSGNQYFAERQRIFARLGFQASALSRMLRNAYHLTPPTMTHRERETFLESQVKYHDGYSVKLRIIERRIARQQQ